MSISSLLIVDWKDDAVVILDQRQLPVEETYLTLDTVEKVADAIKTLAVRGAPAIGVAGALGLALGIQKSSQSDFASLKAEARGIADTLHATRPTAVNLAWGLQRILAKLDTLAQEPILHLKAKILEEARKIKEDDVACNQAIGRHGQTLLQDGDTVLTHCNAGALATAGYGTALGVIYAAIEAGKKIQVFADETRPLGQGARLTAWELHRHGVPVTVITDSMAAFMMQKGLINKVIVGADRIAANGDTANKIGTYSVAIASKFHNIPFYVAAPASTFDLKTASGSQIPIEERSSDEIRYFSEKHLVPHGVAIKNPAFDVTPHHLISAFITEKGVLLPPFVQTLPNTLG